MGRLRISPRRHGRCRLRRPALRLEALEPRVVLSGDPSALEVLNAAPALFAANLGQWQDPSVRYLFQGAGTAVAHTEGGPVFLLSRPEQGADGASFVHSTSFAVTFVGAENVAPVGLDPSEAVYNYYVGDPSTWRSEVPTFETVGYLDLWAGVDLLTWGRRDGLKYEFRIAPGADPGQIRLRYEGIEGLWLDDSGALHVVTPLGEVVDDAPFIYQEIGGERVQVAGAFLLADACTLSFAITGSYDPGFTLVIDPTIAWSSYLGGDGDDFGIGVAVDTLGNAFLTGTTATPPPQFPTTGGFDTTLGGTSDAFITKVSGAGSLLWSTYLGGSGTEAGYGIAVDGLGNVFVVGRTTSSDFPTTGGFDTTLGGTEDAFITKVSGAGALLWSSYLGGSGKDSASSVATDGFGDAFVVGYTESSNFPATGGFDTVLSGTSDAFITKVSGTGSLLWSSYLGGTASEGANRVAVQSGNAYIIGSTTSSDFPTTGGFDTSLGGLKDAFVAKVTGGGSLAWSSYLGGSGLDDGYGIAVDGLGDVFVTGETASSDFPAAGGFQTIYGGGTADGFVARINSAGSLLWSSYLGGSGYDYGDSIAVDGSGDAYVTGETGSTNFPTSGGFDTSLGGTQDAFVAKVSAAGALVWSSYLGGSAGDVGWGIAVDGSGDLLVTGYTTSTNFPVSGGFDTTHGGYADVFITKVSTAAANHAPTLTTVNVLTGAAEDQDYTITYAALAAAADEADVDGDPLSFRVEAVTSGTLTKGGVPVTPGATLLSAGESLVWHPAANANGTLQAFTVRAWDGQAASATAVPVSVQVAAVNDAPSFTKGADQTTNEDAGLRTIAAWATNISPGPADEAGQTVDFLVTNDNNGLFSSQPAIAANGTLTYTPAPNAHGIATVTVRLHDDGGTANGGSDTSAPQTFTITVNPVADTPSVTDATTDEDTQTSSGLVISRNAVDGPEVTHFKITGITGGTLYQNNGTTAIPDGSFITFAQANAGLKFTPAPNSTAPGSFTVQASTANDDSGLGGGTVTATITVNPVNDPPTADAQNLSTAEDTPLAITLTGSDGDPEAVQTLTFAIATGPSHGTLSGFNPATGAVTYTPHADYHGPDSFTFTVTDDALAGAPAGLASAPATVSLTITPVNDPPTADAQNLSTAEDTPLAITLTGSDGDPEAVQTLTFATATGPSHGTLSGFNPATGAVTYTPHADYHGPDSFTFTVTDDALAGAPAGLASAPATVSLTITPVNDPPVAQHAVFSVAEGGSHSGNLVATDVDGDPLTYAIVAGPSHGTLTAFDTATGAFTYAPTGTYNGPDSFTFKADDGTVDSNEATITITVTPVNNAPVAQNGAFDVAEDGRHTGSLVATDVDGNPLHYAIVTGPAHGTLTAFDPATGAFTYEPAPDYHGPDAFTFKANDGAADSNPATVSITVTPVNDAPVFQGLLPTDPTVMFAGQIFAFTFSSSDVDGDSLTYSLVSGPSWLSMDPETGALSGMPTLRAHLGTRSVTVRVSDGQGGSDEHIFQITIQGQVIALGSAIPAPLTKVTFTDASGDLVSVGAKAKVGAFYLVRGVAQGAPLTTPADLVAIEGEGTDAKAGLSLKVSSPVKAPLPDTSVRDIVVTGSFSLSAATLNLLGNMTVTGGLGKFTLGNVAGQHLITIGTDPLAKPASLVLGRVQDTTLNLRSPLKALSVIEWLDTDATPDQVIAPWIGSLITRGSKTVGGPAGHFEADLVLSGAGATKGTLGKATIAGSVTRSAWTIVGSVASVSVRGHFTNSTLVADLLGSVAIGGAITENGADGDTDVIRATSGGFALRDATGSWWIDAAQDHWFGTLRAFVG